MLKDKLIAARTAKKLTQQNVADYLMVKRQTYSSYERGVSIPDSSTLKKLSRLFEVPADELLGIEKSPSELDELLSDPLNKELLLKLAKLSPETKQSLSVLIQGLQGE